MKTKKINLKITGMTCDYCALSIKNLLLQNKGITNAVVNYPDGTCDCSYDPSQTDENEIISTINATQRYKAKPQSSRERKSKNKYEFDLIIIGGGSAGFAAAIQAESLEISTLMINGGLDFGGTCVNVGCIPSKTLIHNSQTIYHCFHSNFEAITPKGANIDFTSIIRQKKKLVSALQQKKYMDVVINFKNLTLLKGMAKFIDNHTVIVDNKNKYTAKKFIIATGASTNIPSIEGLNQIDYLTNISLFELEEKPKSITILGAGYIGCEIAMAYNRFDIQVRVMDFTPHVLNNQTKDICEELEKNMRKENIEIILNARIIKFEKNKDGVLIHYKTANETIYQLIEKDKIVLATGIKPNTFELNLQTVGVNLTKTKHIKVNNKMQTNIANIYAAGDVVNTPAFVYTAAYEGKIAIMNAMTFSENTTDYSSLPWVIFTDPQIAGVGLDENQAKQQKIPYEVSKVYLSDIPKAITANETTGFIKLIRNSKTNKLIGARIVASEGGEVIQQLSMAIKYGIGIEELANNIYPYLTLSEGIKLAAIGFDKDISKLSCCAN